MRIKSNFKDYYDSCQSFGTDDIVYMRYTSNEMRIGHNLNTFYLWSESNHSYRFEEFHVGFCGKYYVGYKIIYLNKELTAINTYVYSNEQLEKYLTEKSITKDCNMGRWFINKDLFVTHKKVINDDLPIFIIYSKPESYFKYDSYRKDNPELKSIDFGKVFDAYSAYQEIHSYLNNKAIPIKPIPQLDDKTMRDIKGFDKYSFKKDPSNRRKV